MARYRAVLLSALMAGLVGVSAPADPMCNPHESLHDRLIRHEGIVSCVYEDQYGNPTIGVGHFLKRPADLGMCWNSSKIISALEHDIARARSNAIHDIGMSDLWHGLPRDVQDILIEMAFQLGGHGLEGFHAMLAAVVDHEWATAADEMLNSLWARQTPKRATELACLMRGVG